MNNFIFCSECGTKYMRGTKFCSECGQSLASLTPTVKSAPAAAPAPAPVQSKPPTVMAARWGEDEDSDPVDRLESIGHINLNALAVEITKDRSFVEKVGDAMLNPLNPADIPKPRGDVGYSVDKFREEASALQQNSRQRGVHSTEIKG